MSNQTIPENTKNTPGIFLIRRWLTMLLRQQENFTQYLHLISREQAALAAGDLMRMEKYFRQEDCLVKGIRAVDKVTKPLAAQFTSQYPAAGDLLEKYGINKLQAQLKTMQAQILAGIAENKRSLEHRSTQTLRELKQIRKNRSRSVSFNRPATPAFVDIAG